MIDNTLPYASQRAPVLAKNLVATSQPLAAQAGLRMLLTGGNAVDAALAAAITLTVVEPTSNGIGGDAFAIVWDGKQLHGLNASGRSPRGMVPERFEGHDNMPMRGWESVTVPGAVSGWTALSERFGRLPFEDLFQPAIQYAREGFAVSPVTARAWRRAPATFAAFPEFQRHFLPNGRSPETGEFFRSVDQATTLERIAATLGADFYTGDLAERIVADAKKHGAALSADDLGEHRAEWVGTISKDYQGSTVHEIPPNGQGLAALMALGILDHLDIASHPIDSADSLHLQIEAMKLALADCYRYVADPDHMHFGASALLDEGYLASRARTIDLKSAAVPRYGVPKPGGTVYLTTADAQGMMVSFIQSNYYGFGSGIVIPGTGIAMQNRGAGFVLTPDHPNQLGGGKRPFHTIIPAFLTRNGQPQMSFGVMGGPMQAQGHVQMVLRTVDYGQNPQAAVDAPRWQVLGGTSVAVERGYPDAVLAELTIRGHDIRETGFGEDFAFGGAQLICKTNEGYVAGSDPRKDGQAVGY